MTDSPDKALNEVVEDDNLDATPASETNDSEEVSTEPTEPTGEEGERETETGEVVQKKGYNQRVQELVKERNQERARAQSLEERIAELTAPVEQQQQYQVPQEEPIIAPGEEIDASELEKRLRAREQRILQQARTEAQLMGKQSEAINRHVNESSQALKAYPELDPDSGDFNRDLSESITEAVEAHVRANPYSASVKKFVDKLMKPYKGAVSKEAGKVAENIARQASETAVRPTAVSKTEKSFDDLSIDEMEKELGVVVS